MATQTLVSFEQFAEIPEKEGVLYTELDEGVVIEMAHPSFAHGGVQGNVFAFLKTHAGSDFLISQNAGFVLAPDVVRAPDVCLVRRAALEAMERVKGGSHRGAPDLAVEVVSESETARDLDRKVQQYLRSGATAVWALYPDTRYVTIYRRSGETLRVGPGQSFQEPELLPGVSIPVDDFFAGIAQDAPPSPLGASLRQP